MRRLLFPLCYVLTLLSLSIDTFAEEKVLPRYQEGKVDGASLEYVHGMPVMFLAGTPEEIGKQQAELVSKSILPLIDMPRRTVEEHGAKQFWPAVVGMSNFLMKNAPQDHKAELDALIKYGELDHGSLYVANSLVELRRMGGCASFVVMPEKSETGEIIFGRNFDFPALGVLDTYHCILVVKPKGKHAFLSIGYPGLVGVISGMNDAGLTVATLDVYESGDDSPYFDSTGVPLALTYRRILEECTTVAEAEKILQESKRTTYMNLAVSDTKSAAVFELTPENVGVRTPEKSVLSCTNHFRLEELVTDLECRRYTKLSSLRDHERLFDVASVQRAMHAVNQGQFTLQTMVFEPASLKVHVAMGGPGPVSNHPMETFDLKELLAK